jgi:sterol desaturase/sphingolipid hydroxylase (fatty acid hydroxylase superfamily)
MPNLEHYGREARRWDPAGAILTNLVWLVVIPKILINCGPSAWLYLLSQLGTERNVYMFLLLVPTIFFLSLICFVFMLADLYLPVSLLKKYKMQPQRMSNLDWQHYRKAWKQFCINSFIVVPLLGLFFLDLVYPAMYGAHVTCLPADLANPSLQPSETLQYLRDKQANASGTSLSAEVLEDCTLMPPAWTFVKDFIVFGMLYDFVFYFIHRFLHLKNVFGYNLYGLIHKKHHEFTSPIAVSCVYAHPIEHVLANVGPLFFGPLLMRSHPIVTFWWFSYGLYHTAAVHSGYHCWFLPSPLKHDWHHERFEENYSSMGIWDGLFKTNVEYLANQKAYYSPSPSKKRS